MRAETSPRNAPFSGARGCGRIQRSCFTLVRYVETRGSRSMSQERPEIEETIERWAQARLEALAAEAGEVASRFYLRAAQERANRPRGEWGRLGVRVRTLRAARAAPGAFAIEWFTRRWVNKTGSESADLHDLSAARHRRPLPPFGLRRRRPTLGDRARRDPGGALRRDPAPRAQRLAGAHGLSPAREARTRGGRGARAKQPRD